MPRQQFSDFAKHDLGSEHPKMSDSDNSDNEMEKAISSIKSCEKELKQKCINTNENYTYDSSKEAAISKNINLEIKKEDVIDDFKTRKQQHVLPSKCARRNPFIEKQQTKLSQIDTSILFLMGNELRSVIVKIMVIQHEYPGKYL